MSAMTNEDIIKVVQEKLAEKNEVIKEQQMQIVELQEQIENLEAKVSTLEEAKDHDKEELVKRLNEVLD